MAPNVSCVAEPEEPRTGRDEPEGWAGGRAAPGAGNASVRRSPARRLINHRRRIRIPAYCVSRVDPLRHEAVPPVAGPRPEPGVLGC